MSTAEKRAIRAARRVRGEVPAEDAQQGLAAPANPARSVQPASIDGQELGHDGLAEGADEDRNTDKQEDKEDDRGGQADIIDLIGAESKSQDSHEEQHANDGRHKGDGFEREDVRGEEQDEPDHPSDSTSDSSDSSSSSSDSSDASSTSSEEGSDEDGSDTTSSSSEIPIPHPSLFPD
ncbi:uncharacterized protein MELLADRAFT_84675 [Melampsora larici-populina 98AG31]|uniref:Uncharacterized protein n=1 Tax=Melampsora larici-populina (strain 98AG31 / pathotype 3-4-7) TaxID=747676 RepID=F4RGF4_MELLP|nr:uncharacterized protein MELLADRAFT_84675 [Melampsora larici-populina 98AG31]EGG08661.1 hypothetical protein MELLADRAFT_84675 [Melampsora larici-populina 98AG31]